MKRILKVLKRSGDDIEEIKFVSRKLRLTLRNGNIGDVKTTNINFDHDSLISKSFWSYVKRFLTSKDKKLPSFTEADCISFFRGVFTSMNPNKIFRIPSWIPLFAPPQIPFNLDPPSYQQVTNVIRNMKASGSPFPLDQISVIAFKGQLKCKTKTSKQTIYPHLNTKLYFLIIFALSLTKLLPSLWLLLLLLLSRPTV